MTNPTRGPGALNRAIAGEIRAELARRQWSQVELAGKLGVDQMWLSRRLRAVKPLTLTEFEAIAHVLDLTPAELLGRAAVAPGQPTLPKVPGAVRPGDGRPKNRGGRGDSGPSAVRLTHRVRDLTREELSLVATAGSHHA